MAKKDIARRAFTVASLANNAQEEGKELKISVSNIDDLINQANAADDVWISDMADMFGQNEEEVLKKPKEAALDLLNEINPERTFTKAEQSYL